jgi:acyl-CoA dehydrogenase
MAIDFSFPPELELLRAKVREFIEGTIRPIEDNMDESNRSELVSGVIKMRQAAQEAGLWLPHMPEEFGGMGLGHVAMAAVSAEAAKSRFGSFALNAQAPDEGNMHTLLHWATDEQKEQYLRPLCEGQVFAIPTPDIRRIWIPPRLSITIGWSS